jgi:branched-chain amino acid transport system substrate-binding protein
MMLIAACGSQIPESEIAAAEGGTSGGGGSTSGFALPGSDPEATAPGTGSSSATTGTAGTAATTGAAKSGSGSSTTGASDSGNNPTTGGANPTTGGAAPTTGGAAPTTGGTGGTSGTSGGSQKLTLDNLNEGCTKAGAPINIGQVVSASGLIGQSVGTAVPALAAWAAATNASGGLACHPVVLNTVDDASDPARSNAGVANLVQNKKAVAIVGSYVPISIAGFRTAINKFKVPAVGGDNFSLPWWQDPLFYPVGTYVDVNAFGSTTAVAKIGKKKVAILYCVEAGICPPYKDAVKGAAAKSGYQVVYESQVTITAPDYSSACQSAKAAGADQISMIIDAPAVSRLARSCAQIGYTPAFAIASLAVSFDRGDANIRKNTATLASAAAPWFEPVINKGQGEFLAAMKKYAPGLELDPTTSLAWANGQMLKAAIVNLGKGARDVPITSEMIRKGLSMVKGETLNGMIAPNSYSPTRGPNPKDMCYFPAQFTANGTFKALVPGSKGYTCA